MSYTYLASPYTHPDEAVREQRFSETMLALKFLLKRKIWTYSPIVHCHGLAQSHRLPHTWDFWWEYNQAMLKPAERLMILALDGWQESAGVDNEIGFAFDQGILIEFMMPTTHYGTYVITRETPK